MEYVNALNEEDADLATEVQNLRTTLAAEKADQEALQAKRERALEDVETQLAVLDGKLDEQQAILEDLNAAKERAQQLVKRLDKKLKRELAALLGIGKAFNGSSSTARSTSRGRSTTGSARLGTAAGTTRTPATTSSRRKGRRSARRSTGTRRPATTVSAGTR